MRSSHPDAPRSDERAESHSGLHEIKALARSARQQISKKRSAADDELERNTALLASASSSGLRAAVRAPAGSQTTLPRPVSTPSRPRQFASGTDAAAIMPRLEPAERQRGLPTWLIAVVGAALVCAVTLFITFKIAGKDAKAEAVRRAPAEPVVSGLTPKAPAPEKVAAVAAEAKASETTPAVVAAAEEPSAAPASEPAADIADRRAPAQRAERKAARRDRRSRKNAASPARTAKRDEEAAARAPTREPVIAADDRSSDDVAQQALAELLGEAPAAAHDSTTAPAPEVAEKPAVPEKKALTKSDVTAGLRKIAGRVAKCEKPAELSANVMVRFTVEPEGRVSRAKAIGEHAGTRAGACVAAAVKAARFPATSGRPMSFTLPFFLNP